MAPAAVVVNLREPGILRQPDVVLIDNRTKWGNPYRVGVNGEGTRVVDLYRDCRHNDRPDLLARVNEVSG